MKYQVAGWNDGKFIGLRGPTVQTYEQALEIASDPKHKEWGVRWTVVPRG